MEIKTLTEIVRTQNNRRIKSELKRLDFIDCIKDKSLKEVSLIDLANSQRVATESFTTKNGKYEYDGEICTGVSGYEDMEFIIISVNKIHKDKDLSFPYKMFIYAKKITKEV